MNATITAVQFVSPLPGLGAHTSFTLDRIDGAEGLFALRSTRGDVRLFVIDPASAGYGLADEGGYRPSLTAGVRAQVGATDASEVRLFVVANPAEDGVFLNLRAPILIHRDTGRAAQVILDDQAYPIRALLGRTAGTPVA
ncbi:flagellar assembly protein FliW [Microbacterium sp. NPDC057407]|uniref:flagellar assembly protein FliW n=1 Tax=Microbacterium sp. NPDC057407 TaxID=3346120 RepID=UPI00366AABA3